MARTVRTKVFKFDELSPVSQQKAIDNNRDAYSDASYIYDEAHDSVKAFHEIFGTQEGRKSWLDANTSMSNENILLLKGLRLAKYIWNNYKTSLYKGKYYSTSNKSRHSKIILDNCCVLTGVSYDDILLQPVYEFLEGKLRPDYNTYMDFEALVNDCFESLRIALEKEEDYLSTDEYIREQLYENECEFTRDGKNF